MGYYKNLIIAQQVEVPDRPVQAKRRSTWFQQDVVTDRRTMLILLGLSVFFGVYSVVLTIWVAWLV